MNELTQERLKYLLHYDPETGVFTWRVNKARAKAGAIAGTPHIDGYLQTRIDGRPYLLHRLAWLYVHGRMPSDMIDHVNGVRRDNRLCNLREATNSQNMRNRIALGGKSGLKGAFPRRNGRFQSAIQVDGKQVHLGTFKTAEDAHAAYVRAANDNFGEYARAS